MKKNLVILDKVVKYNAIKIYGGNTIRVPDYIINHCIEKRKELIITHKGEVVLRFKGDEIFLNINTIDSKEYDGVFAGEKLKFKLALYTLKD